MRPKSIILLILALGCGLIASVGINQVMATRDNSAGAEMVPIYVAAMDININDPVPKEKVRLEQWPADKVHPDALHKLEDIEGRRATVKIIQGEPMLGAKLLAKGERGSGITDLIPPGFRVVAVRVDDVASSGGLVRQGDRVDLLVHLPANPARGIPNEMTRTFLQDVKVFAVNDEAVRGATGEKISVKSVSLLVTPHQAQKVTLATEMGRIRLVMRGDDDGNVDVPENVDIKELIGDLELDSNRNKESPGPRPEPSREVAEKEPPVASETSEESEEDEDPPFVMTLVLAGTEVKEYEFVKGGRVGVPRDEHGPLLPEREQVKLAPTIEDSEEAEDGEKVKFEGTVEESQSQE